MDFKSLGEEIAKIGLPLLGSILPIPGGVAIGTALAAYISSPSAKPEDILATLSTSAEAVQKAKEFEGLHNERMMQMRLDFDKSEETNQANVIIAEAKGESWLQQNWRPLTMISFSCILWSYWLGYGPENLTQDTINQLFELLKIGIGGYIASRGVEKTVPGIVDAIKGVKK